MVSVATTQLCCYSAKAAIGDVNLACKWVWLCSHTTLFMDTEIWISHNFYVTQNISLLLSWLLRNIRAILRSWLYKPGWIWPTGWSVRTVLHHLLKFPSGFHSGVLLENSPFIGFLIFPILLPGHLTVFSGITSQISCLHWDTCLEVCF